MRCLRYPKPKALLSTLTVGLLTLLGCQDAISTDSDPVRQTEQAASASGGQAGSAGQHTNRPDHASLQAQLAQVRRATARFHRFKHATNAGYFQFSKFIPGMGLHYVQRELITANKTFDWGKKAAFGSAKHRNNPPLLVYSHKGNSSSKRLVSAEYAVPKSRPIPTDLFAGTRDDGAWHVHPSVHELIPPARPHFTSIEGACHYEKGFELLLAVTDTNDKITIVPPTGTQFGGKTWTTLGPESCPEPGPKNTDFRGFHRKVWTLHVWLWRNNPEGLFHPTNPRVRR